MSEPIKIIFLGEPQAQKRHRSTRANWVPGGIRNYDPSAGKKQDFLSVIQSMAPEKPLEGPLRIDSTFYFGRPKAHYRTGKNAHLLRDNAPQYHISKPDRDNLDKFCLDAMKGIFFKDDCQVCEGEIRKLYSDNPRIELVITEL